MKYRKLKIGEKLKEGDEFFNPFEDDWVIYEKEFLTKNLRVKNISWPVRRLIK